MVKTVVFEGQPAYLAKTIKAAGVNNFISFAYKRRLSVELVKNALDIAGVKPDVGAAALNFYCTKLREVGVTYLPRGIGLQENLKRLSPKRFKASLLLDNNLNLMPEMIVDPETSVFITMDEYSTKYAMGRNAIYVNRNIDIYQPICHSLSMMKGAYIIEVENEWVEYPTPTGMHTGWNQSPIVKFYLLETVDTATTATKRSNTGLLTARVTCSELKQNVMKLIASNRLLEVVHIRAAATLFPQFVNCQ